MVKGTGAHGQTLFTAILHLCSSGLHRTLKHTPRGKRNKDLEGFASPVSEFSATFTDGVWKSETTWDIEVVLVLEGTEEGMENMLQTSDSTLY